MDRPIQYEQSQLRTFDLLSGWKDAMVALGNLGSDAFGAPGSSVVAGFTPSYNGNLTVTFDQGRVYTLAAADATLYSVLPADTTVTLQQGQIASQTLTFSTAGLSAGQSMYALVEVLYAQSDAIASGDPSSGLLTYYNPSDPTSPYLGPGGLGTTNTTVRQNTVTTQIKYGTPAATGSQVPPTPDTNYAPLYLVNLTDGQTSITGADVFVCGPSVAAGVPSNYPYAPFIAGLLNSHHSGNAGQAPKIKLASEVQGTMALGNLPVTSATGTIPTVKVFAGNPNTNVAGTVQDFLWDSTHLVLWECTTTGTASTAVWTAVGAKTVAGNVTDNGSGVASFTTIGGVTKGDGSVAAGITGISGMQSVVFTDPVVLSTKTAAGSGTINIGTAYPNAKIAILNISASLNPAIAGNFLLVGVGVNTSHIVNQVRCVSETGSYVILNYAQVLVELTTGTNPSFGWQITVSGSPTISVGFNLAGIIQ